MQLLPRAHFLLVHLLAANCVLAAAAVAIAPGNNRCLMTWFDTSVLKHRKKHKDFLPFVLPSSFHQSNCCLQSQNDGWLQLYSLGQRQHWRQLLFVKYSWSRGDTYWFLHKKFILHKSPAVALRFGVRRRALRLEPDAVLGSMSQMHTFKCFLPFTSILKSAHLSQRIFYRRDSQESWSLPFTLLAGKLWGLGQRASCDLVWASEKNVFFLFKITMLCHELEGNPKWMQYKMLRPSFNLKIDHGSNVVFF